MSLGLMTSVRRSKTFSTSSITQRELTSSSSHAIIIMDFDHDYPGYEVEYEEPDYPSTTYPLITRAGQQQKPIQSSLTNNNNNNNNNHWTAPRKSNIPINNNHNNLLWSGDERSTAVAKSRNDSWKAGQSQESMYQDYNVFLNTVAMSKPPPALPQQQQQQQIPSSPNDNRKKPPPTTSLSEPNIMSNPTTSYQQHNNVQYQSASTNQLSVLKAPPATDTTTTATNNTNNSDWLNALWAASSDSSAMNREPKEIIWADSSEPLLDYDNTMDHEEHDNNLHVHSAMESDSGLIKRQDPLSPESDGLMKTGNRRSSSFRKRDSVASTVKVSGSRPYLVDNASSQASSSLRRIGSKRMPTHPTITTDSDYEKKPKAADSTLHPQAQLPPPLTLPIPSTMNSVSAARDERFHRNMRANPTTTTTYNTDLLPLTAITDNAAATSIGHPPRAPPPLPPPPPSPGTFTSIANNTDANDRINRKVRGTARISNPLVSSSDLAQSLALPRPATVTSVSAAATPNDPIQRKLKTGSITNNSHLTTTTTTTILTNLLEPDDDMACEPEALSPRPGTVTSITHNNQNDRVANKIRASYNNNHRPMMATATHTAIATTTSTATDALLSSHDSLQQQQQQLQQVALEEPTPIISSRPGTMTSVSHFNNNNNSTSDRVASKIRASLATQSSVATSSIPYDSDVTLEEPHESNEATLVELPRPGTVTAVANNNNNNDRVANKIRTSMANRPAMTTQMSDSDIAMEEPLSRPGTVTAVATNNRNDRVANKIRASMASRPAMTTQMSDSDIAMEEPLSRPGTVTSVVNNSRNDRVANKIRASMTSRPVMATQSSDSDIAMEEPLSRPGTVTAVATNNRNDRVANKIRASMASRPAMATQSSDSDIAMEEPLSRPGTVTSVVNNSRNDRVASKIRASVVSRPAMATLSSDSDIDLEEPLSRPGTVTSVVNNSRNDRVAGKMRASMASRPAMATMSSDSDVAMEEPLSLPGTVTSFANNDRVAGKIRASAATRPPVTPLSSNSDIALEEPTGGTFTTVARSSNDRVANKIRSSVGTHQRTSNSSLSSTHSDEEKVEEPEPALAGTVTAVMTRNGNDRIANKIRRASLERRAAAHSHAEDLQHAAAVGAVATKGDDPARAKTRWIQDDLFRDEEEAGYVEVDPEAYFNQRTREMAAQREREKLSTLLERDEEEKSGLLKEKHATFSRISSGDGLLKTTPTSYKSRSIRKVKKLLGPPKGTSYVRRDESSHRARKDEYEKKTMWDELDKATLCVGCIILVSVLIALITPIVMLGRKGAKLKPPDLRLPLFPHFQQILQSVSDPAALANRSTAQGMALNFIVYDDPYALSVDSPNLVQRYVLMVLYYSTGGPIWQDQAIPWGSGYDECSWDFVECNNVVLQNSTKRYIRFLRQGEAEQRSLADQLNRSIVGLHLYRAGLLGTLPDEIRELSNLVTLDLGENRLAASTIPNVIYNLTNLGLVSLENNRFHGTINKAIGDLSKLSYLSLFNNDLTGTLPSTFSLLTKLEIFYAFGNSPLKGPFFRYALRWPMIKRIDIKSNAFSGSIPTEISRLSHLEVLGLASNSFGGTLPTTLGKLPLQILTTSENTRMIKGTIPTEFGRLTDLTHLLLDSGALTGTIPTELGNLRSAVQISLSQNKINGTIPSQLGRCTSLTDLELNSNYFSGTIPSELGKVTGLQILYLQQNLVEGPVPQQICSLRNRSLLVFWADCALPTSGVQCSVPECCTACKQ